MGRSYTFNPLSGQFDIVSDVTIGSPASGLAIDANQALTLALSSTSTTGALSNTDWNTFNGKQAAGNYITALTSDVTAAGPGSVAATIASNVVSNAKLAQMAAHTFKGNNTGSTANALDLTATQLTAELNQFTSVLQGVVPLSGGGTTNFLRADGSWATPPAGTGTVSSVGMTVPTFLSIAGSPVTTTGTLAVTLSGTALPVSSGGTNSVAALNNNRIIQSSGSAIVEAAAITAARALISDANGIPTHATTTATEIGYVNGVTSAIQTQLNAKAPIASPTFTGVATSPAFTFTPQSSDPGSPVEGEVQYADGTARVEGLWVYTNGAWLPVGTNAGYIGTDWVNAGATTISAITTPPTKGNSPTTDVVFWRRVGDSAHIRIYYKNSTSTGSAAGSSDYLFGVPASIGTIDLAKVVANNSAIGPPAQTLTNIFVVGTAFVTASPDGGDVSVYNNTYVRVTGADMAGTTSYGCVGSGFSPMSAAAACYALDFVVPISGWASNTVAAVQSINARAHNSATSISGTLATIVWTTEDYDTNSALASGVFTCPSSGKYQVDAALVVSGTFILNNTSIMQLQVNGVAVADTTHYIAAALTNESIQLSTAIQLSASDTVRIQYSTQGTAPAIVSSDTKNYFSISKIGN